MRRATTPIYKFTFPFDLNAIDDVLITFRQGSRKLSKSLADGTISGKVLGIVLSEEETNTFSPGNAEVQARCVKDGVVMASDVAALKIRPVLDDRILSLNDNIVLSDSIVNEGTGFIEEIEQTINLPFSEAYEIVSDTVEWDSILNKPETFPPSAHTHSAEQVSIDTSDMVLLDDANVQEAIAEIDRLIDSGIISAGQSMDAIQTHTTDIRAFPGQYDTNYHVQIGERNAWNSKYNKPTTGIPYNDLAEAVQTSLNKADSSIQSLDGYATEDFVNSSIATQTANFIGTFESVDDLKAYAGTKTPNDYAFVIIYDPIITTQVKQYDRYKWNGAEWLYEYTLNNSSFTAEQWAAINSGITLTLVDKLKNVDTTVTKDSGNLVTSGAVYTAIRDYVGVIFDAAY